MRPSFLGGRDIQAPAVASEGLHVAATGQGCGKAWGEDATVPNVALLLSFCPLLPFTAL